MVARESDMRAEMDREIEIKQYCRDKKSIVRFDRYKNEISFLFIIDL